MLPPLPPPPCRSEVERPDIFQYISPPIQLLIMESCRFFFLLSRSIFFLVCFSGQEKWPGAFCHSQWMEFSSSILAWGQNDQRLYHQIAWKRTRIVCQVLVANICSAQNTWPKTTLIN